MSIIHKRDAVQCQREQRLRLYPEEMYKGTIPLRTRSARYDPVGKRRLDGVFFFTSASVDLRYDRACKNLTQPDHADIARNVTG